MIRAGIVGGGVRASAAHYPAISRLENVHLEAICDLNATRLAKIAEQYHVERRYTEYRQMLAEAQLDAVYVITPPQFHVPIVLDCLNAGAHVFVEKPPAMSSHDLEVMIAAAERKKCFTAACFQRRYAPVAQEVRKMILQRGPVTLCGGQFHKNTLYLEGPLYGVSALLEDIIHAVDFVRYMCGGEANEVHAFQDRLFVDWKNCYNALMRFESGAVGIVSGNRSAGGRALRFDIHGRGISAYIDMPERAEIWLDQASEPIVLTGPGLVGSTDEQDYEGTLAIHRHFIECIERGREPDVSFRRCLGTMRLVEQMEGP
jgi:predicted dehydrogenase